MAERREPRWPAALAIVVAMGLYLILPQELIIGPRWLLHVIEGLLVIPLLITNPDRSEPDTAFLRTISIVLIAVVSAANLSALGLLVHDLLTHTALEGKSLIYSAVALWATSVIVF